MTHRLAPALASGPTFTPIHRCGQLHLASLLEPDRLEERRGNKQDERTSSLSAGTNALLRLGAIPVTAAGDVLELFDLAPVSLSRSDVGATAQAVLTILGGGPLSADEIARAAGIEAAPLSASLMELELAGRVTLADGVYRAAL